MNLIERLFSLKGQCAVVIGGTGTLCGEMAQGLGEAGAHVIVVGRNQERGQSRVQKIQSVGGSAGYNTCDVGCRESLQGLVKSAVSEHGKVDILVNGAGINSATSIFDIEDDEFARILDINLGAVLRSCQVFGQQMIEQENGGSIINLGSISGLGPLSRVFTYSASKAAVHNLSKNLAREWAEQGVRVNTLVPGFFPAEQNKKVLTEDRISSIMGHTPANRFGEPWELLGATLLLASREAGSFITGVEMIVDGGFSSMSI